jgi:hypothetical protein
MIDPLERANECARALETCSEPDQKLVLANLRELWLSVANARLNGKADRRLQLEHLERLHEFIRRSLQQPPS